MGTAVKTPERNGTHSASRGSNAALNIPGLEDLEALVASGHLTVVRSQPRMLNIPLPEFTTARVRLIGATPLIVDAFSEARKAKLAKSQDGSAKEKPGPRVPELEFLEAQYIDADGVRGVPKLAFVKAIKSAAVRMTEMKGTEVLAALQIATPDELIPLIAGEPTMRMDHVVRMGRGNLAYRATFWPWEVILPIKLDHEVVSFEQAIHVITKAGRGVGLGNWRPEKNGDSGRWEIGDVLDYTVFSVASKS